MQAILSVTLPPQDAWSPEDLMGAIEEAARQHAYDLHVEFDRMYQDFGVLWMIVRSRYRLTRQPKGALTVRTWLRKPTPAISLRDFSLEDEEGIVGEAVQTWILADIHTRRLVSFRDIPMLWELPTPAPERTGSLRVIRLPELQPVGSWTVGPDEIDDNGHLNNVMYVRHAQKLVPPEPMGLDIIYDRECFEGETLTLEAAQGYVRGVKADGSESFRARFLAEP